MKKDCLFVLFCLYFWDPLNRVLGITFLILFGKLLRRRGASAWFHGIWTCNVEVLEYWMIFSLKIESNHSWKFRRNWNVPLVFLERCWWENFNGIYLIRFGFNMWEILIFKWFLPLKIQINSKKPSFGRKNQLRTWSNLKACHSIPAWFPFIFGCSKNRFYIAKRCSYVDFPYFVMGSHLGQQHRLH
jgi:hypothetical protein